MSPELHQRVRKLFDEALEKPESERRSFLESAAGGDAELRQAVERLLDAHGKSDAFLAGEETGGRRLGRYLLTRELGRGSMGVVFEGIDPLIGRHVAVKVIRIDPGREGDKPGFLRDQFFREAHSAGRLLHPGIVVIFDVGQQGDAAFIAMELVEGHSLQDLLSAKQPPSVPETLEILRQAAAALDYAHQNGVVHRDIKPANIMLHRGQTVKIADFGVAKITLQNLTVTGLILGTPTYMSPEQLENRPLDGRSDQFSLAVVAYEMLTGVRPFDAPSLAPLTHLIVYGERPSARKVNPELSEAADAVLRKGLAQLPEGRYANCVEFAAALAEALREAPRPLAAVAPPIPAVEPPPVATAPVPPPPMPVPPAAVRERSALVWVLAGLLGIAAMLGGAVWVYRSSPLRARFESLAARRAPAAPEAVVTPPATAPPAHPTPTPAAPAVARFTASPESVAAGSPATLHWEAHDAGEVRIEPQVGQVAASGEVSVKPDATTTYILTAKGPGGEASASLTVAVAPKGAEPKAAPPAGSLFESGLAEQRAGNAAKALSLFRQAAERGDVRAMVEVAEQGLDSDNGESERWFRKAAELGDPTAMLNLGAMYSLGIHVKEDDERAVFWYRQAADKGNSDAMYNLARMYERGHGVPKDLAKAKELYQKASARGNAEARKRLDQLTDK